MMFTTYQVQDFATTVWSTPQSWYCVEIPDRNHGCCRVSKGEHSEVPHIWSFKLSLGVESQVVSKNGMDTFWYTAFLWAIVV